MESFPRINPIPESPAALERLRRAEILEQAITERLGILTDIIGRIAEDLKLKTPKPVRTLVANGINIAGIPGAIKMIGEAATGKTLGGKELTPIGRINHLLVQGTNVLAYYLAINGDFTEAGISYVSSWALYGAQYNPETIGALGKLAEKRAPRAKKIFDAISAFYAKILPRKIFFKEKAADE